MIEINYKKHKTQRIISFFVAVAILIPAFVFLAVPRQTNAQSISPYVFDVPTEGSTAAIAGTNATKTAIAIKDVLKAIKNQLLMVVAKRALAEITKSTVNWINSGFHGAPLFLQNPDSFFKDITKFEIKDLIGVIGYDPASFPFGKQFALKTINSYKQQLSNNLSYSLSKVTNDPALLYNYQNNFNTGGWNTFLLNTQTPQNNYIGFQILANQDLARRLNGTQQNAAQKDFHLLLTEVP